MRKLSSMAVIALTFLDPLAAQGEDPSKVASDTVPAEQAERHTPRGKAGSGFVEARLGYYHHDDPGGARGNPFLDETLTVVSPIVIFDYNVTDDLAVQGSFAYDQVSSASIERLSKFPAHSGASGDQYFGVDLGARYELDDDWQVGGFVAGAMEFDYRSLGFGGHVARDLDNHNTTLKLSARAYFDRLDVILFDATNAGTDERNTASATAMWYQVIDPKTHGEIGTSLTYQEGFLGTPYNAVVVEDQSFPPNPNLANNARGFEITEELPRDRTRAALFGRVRRSLSKSSAVELGGRLYGDSWSVTSFAVEPRWYQWLVHDKLTVRLRYRFYTQTAAEYFQHSFTTTERFRTQDSDLGDFSSHTLGLRFDWYLSESMAIDMAGDYQFRADGLDGVFVSAGARWDF